MVKADVVKNYLKILPLRNEQNINCQQAVYNLTGPKNAGFLVAHAREQRNIIQKKQFIVAVMKH